MTDGLGISRIESGPLAVENPYQQGRRWVSARGPTQDEQEDQVSFLTCCDYDLFALVRVEDDHFRTKPLF